MQRVLARDLLTPDQVRQVRTRSDWRGLWLVVHAWTVIIGSMALFAGLAKPIDVHSCGGFDRRPPTRPVGSHA